MVRTRHAQPRFRRRLLVLRSVAALVSARLIPPSEAVHHRATGSNGAGKTASRSTDCSQPPTPATTNASNPASGNTLDTPNVHEHRREAIPPGNRHENSHGANLAALVRHASSSALRQKPDSSRVLANAATRQNRLAGNDYIRSFTAFFAAPFLNASAFLTFAKSPPSTRIPSFALPSS